MRATCALPPGSSWISRLPLASIVDVVRLVRGTAPRSRRAAASSVRAELAGARCPSNVQLPQAAAVTRDVPVGSDRRRAAALGGDEVVVVRVLRVPGAVLDPVQATGPRPPPRRSARAPDCVPVDARRASNGTGVPLPYVARNCGVGASTASSTTSSTECTPLVRPARSNGVAADVCFVPDVDAQLAATRRPRRRSTTRRVGRVVRRAAVFSHENRPSRGSCCAVAVRR